MSVLDGPQTIYRIEVRAGSADKWIDTGIAVMQPQTEGAKLEVSLVADDFTAEIVSEKTARIDAPFKQVFV